MINVLHFSVSPPQESAQVLTTGMYVIMSSIKVERCVLGGWVGSHEFSWDHLSTYIMKQATALL